MSTEEQKTQPIDNTLYKPPEYIEIDDTSERSFVQTEIDSLSKDIEDIANLIQQFEISRQIVLMTPQSILGNPAIKSIPDRVKRIRHRIMKLEGKYAEIIQSDDELDLSFSKLNSNFERLKEPELNDVEKKGIDALNKLGISMNRIAYASRYETSEGHREQLAEYRSLRDGVALQFADYPELVDQMMLALTMRNTIYGTLEDIKEYKPIDDLESVRQEIESAIEYIESTRDSIKQFEDTRQIVLMLPPSILGYFSAETIPSKIKSIQDRIDRLKLTHPDILQPGSRLSLSLEQLQQPELSEVERQAIAFLHDLKGDITNIVSASNYKSYKDYQSSLASYDSSREKAVSQFAGHPELIGQMRRILDEWEKENSGDISEYKKLKIDAFEQQCKDNIRANSLEHVRPNDGEVVLMHRTNSHPDYFFQSGLGFGSNIDTTATVHYPSSSDGSLVEALFVPHKESSVVIICTLPRNALIRNPNYSDLNTVWGTDVADRYLIKSTDSDRFHCMINPKYIKGSVDRITGKFTPNPRFMEEH